METNAWILDGQNGIESLKKTDNRKLPALGDHDVLMQMHAASLNHRDIAIAEVPPLQPLELNWLNTNKTIPGHRHCMVSPSKSQ